MSDGKIRVGFVGLGHNGVAHLEAHLALGRSEVDALCDRNAARREEAGQRFGVTALFSEAEEMLSRVPLDAVSINTGDAFHIEPFLLALAAGKHVFVEKPLANTEADVHRMVQAADRADPSLKLQVGYILRFNPVFEKLHALARAGRLGEIYYLEADYVHNLLYQTGQTDPVTGRNWYLEEEVPMVGGGSHALDLLRWISGKEVVEVTGYQNHFAFPAMRHDDCQVALFRFEDGTIAKVAALYAPRAEMAPWYNLRAYGTMGTVERDQVALAASPQEVHPALVPVAADRVSGHPYRPEIADWLEAIRCDRPTRTDLYDGANSTLAALCAARAAREKTPVAVPVLTRSGA
jgi:predicted dehydrogenase